MKIVQVSLSFLLEVHTPWRADWLWGCPLIVLTVIIHVWGFGYISQNAILIHRDMKKHRHTIISFALLIGGTTLLATILHGVETALWAVAYCALGALPDFKAAMLYSLGAMTTYGHQNLYLEEHRHLIGTIEALNGWLLFGLSTTFLFWLIQEVAPKYRVES